MSLESINLHSNGQVRDAGTLLTNSTTGETDVTIMGEAAFTRSDGTTGVVADAMFAFQPGQAAHSPEQAEINRMALLFNQVVNTAVDTSSQAALGYVPLDEDTLMTNMVLIADEHNKLLLTTT